jgi:hypothetical protein
MQRQYRLALFSSTLLTEMERLLERIVGESPLAPYRLFPPRSARQELNVPAKRIEIAIRTPDSLTLRRDHHGAVYKGH